MPGPRRRRRINTKVAVALLLTFAAGCVDIIGYLGLFHAFTAHMTGETVHLAQNLFQTRWPDAAKAACVIASFLTGSIIGRTVIEIGSRTRIRRIASATLLIEAALIAGVIPLAGGHTLSEKTGLGLLAMLAAAMGLQTATLTRIGSLTVHTTFVTGMLNKLAQLLSQALFLSYDSRQGRDTAAALHQVLHRARFMIAIWLLYSIGAATGVWMDSIWRLRSLWLPVGIVSFGMVVDQIWPLSLEEEQDQSET
ncbi:MAG TPA: YoaK family protein [Terriglobales bacterium]|nr:YoaK family protein [Terriglobales bacterium]